MNTVISRFLNAQSDGGFDKAIILPALSLALVLMLISLGLAAATEPPEREYSTLDRELDYFAQLLPGDYDNSEQISFDAAAGKPDIDTGGHLRVHSQIRRVDLPAFGEYVFYVEEYKNNDATQIFRQRLYTLATDENEQAIRLKLFFFREGKKYLGAHDDPSLLAGISTEVVMSLKGCDVLIRRDNDWFVGAMKQKTCLFGEEDNRRYSDYQIRLSPQQYWFRDRILDAKTDQPREQVADFSWHQLERARPFICMIDFPRETGGRPVVTHHYIELHDQGGTFSFTHPDGRDMLLSLGHTWSFGMRRETFYVAVQEADTSKPTLVYAWGEPGADRIGVNPGYLRVQCDLDTPANRALQRQLRPDS